MRTSESIVEISKALTAFQAEVETVKKGKKNDFFKSTYADLPSVIATIKPVAAAHGLSIVQGGGQEDGCLVIVTRLIHESGEWIETECPIGIGKQDPQGYGSAYTYGRRYSLQAILGLSAEDDDGNAASQPQKRTESRTKSSAKSSTTPAKRTPVTPVLNDEIQKQVDFIKATAMDIVGGDEKQALDCLHQWSWFKAKNGEQQMADWDHLTNLAAKGSKWVGKTYEKAKLAAEKMAMAQDELPM